MSGTVGQSSLRTDVQQGVVDKTPHGSGYGLVEDARRLREEDVVQPFERARTTDVKDLPEFLRLFQKVLEAAQAEEGTEYPIRFTREYPPIEAELPCFSVKLLSREPWEHKGRRELAPRLMEVRADPDYPGENITIFQRRVRNTIQITVWARTSQARDELAEWLEEKFYQYLWALQWGGVSHPVEFLGRGEDIRREEREQQMYGAPLRFSVITGKLTYRRSTVLRKLTVSLGIQSD